MLVLTLDFMGFSCDCPLLPLCLPGAVLAGAIYQIWAHAKSGVYFHYSVTRVQANTACFWQYRSAYCSVSVCRYLCASMGGRFLTCYTCRISCGQEFHILTYILAKCNILAECSINTEFKDLWLIFIGDNWLTRDLNRASLDIPRSRYTYTTSFRYCTLYLSKGLIPEERNYPASQIC